MLPGGVIDPGVSVGNIVIGETPPGKSCSSPTEGIRLVCEGGKVKEIYVTSPKFYVTRSRLSIGNDVSDIIRFYGKTEPKILKDGILIEYPHLGIDFEIGKKEERIMEIKIYRPKSMEPSRNLQFYREQFKK